MESKKVLAGFALLIALVIAGVGFYAFSQEGFNYYSFLQSFGLVFCVGLVALVLFYALIKVKRKVKMQVEKKLPEARVKEKKLEGLKEMKIEVEQKKEETAEREEEYSKAAEFIPSRELGEEEEEDVERIVSSLKPKANEYTETELIEAMKRLGYEKRVIDEAIKRIYAK